MPDDTIPVGTIKNMRNAAPWLVNNISNEKDDALRMTSSSGPAGDLRLHLYPNPCYDLATLGICGLMDPGLLKLTISNAAGATVEERLLLAEENFSLTLSVAHLPPGAYLLRLIAESMQPATAILLRH